jgi:DNA polymerase V
MRAGLRLVWELRGIPCLPLEVFEQPRKGPCCSRSFGRPVMTVEDLGEAVAMH